MDAFSKGALGSMLCPGIRPTERNWEPGDTNVEFKQQRASQILIGGTLSELVSEPVTHRRPHWVEKATHQRDCTGWSSFWQVDAAASTTAVDLREAERASPFYWRSAQLYSTVQPLGRAKGERLIVRGQSWHKSKLSSLRVAVSF